MKLQNIKRAFTLIELLVVITIIGILATGATTIYTSQIQKARDTTRISSVKALQSAVEQVYQDDSEYPWANNFATDVGVYMESLPKDPKHSQPCNKGIAASGPDCGFAYVAGQDTNGIDYGKYEVSTAFESIGNVEGKAANENDAGNDVHRYEVGLHTKDTDTQVDQNLIVDKKGVCKIDSSDSSAGVDKIIINGNPTDINANQCG